MQRVYAKDCENHLMLKNCTEMFPTLLAWVGGIPKGDFRRPSLSVCKVSLASEEIEQCLLKMGNVPKGCILY